MKTHNTWAYTTGFVVLIAFCITADIAGCTAIQTNKAIVDGQLFCAKATPLGPLTVALATALGGPISVIGLGADLVASMCATINAIPVTPPPNPEMAPVVAAPGVTTPTP